LRRPTGKPFYAGKGKGNRCYEHLKPWHLKGDENEIKVRIIEKIRREGKEPVVEILQEGLSECDAFAIEAAQIKLYGRIQNGGLLANMTDGGEGQSGFHHSEETKRKISEKTRGKNNPFYGKKHDAKTLKKIGDTNRGKVLDESWRNKLSIATRGRPMSADHKIKISLSLIGKKKTAEHLKRIGDAQRGKIISIEQIEKIKETLKKRKLLGLPVGRPKKEI
jgi:group I intron endonuclease